MAETILILSKANSACLGQVAPEVFDNPINSKHLDDFLDDPRHIMLVALEDGLVVGMASGVEYFHPDKPPQLWINEVSVSPAYQRRGIGRKLTGTLVEAARKRGCVSVWLGTAVDNAAAQACFGSVQDVAAPQPFLLYEWNLAS
jgi:ribosomal protein S18 acetylase RimI-like enzyme